MTVETDKLWTIEDLAAFAQVKPSVVKYWLRTIDIPYLKIGRQIRFEAPAIKQWVKRKSISQIAKLANVK